MEKNIFIKNRVIDIQNDVSEKFRNLVMKYAEDRIRGNRSYFSYYVPYELKPLDEVINKNNIVIDPKDPESDYVYERGDDPITDYLLENGCKFGEEIIFLIWW